MNEVSNAKNRINAILKFVDELETSFEKENYIYEQIEKIREENDYELFLELAEKVIEDDDGVSNGKYSAKLQMSLLYQSTLLIEEKIRALQEQLSLEEEKEEDELEGMINLYYHQLFTFLWYYKWILPKLPRGLSVSKDMIDSANEIMHYYYDLLNIDLAMYHKTVMLQNIKMGNIEEAKENYKMWHELLEENSFMNDCEACEVTEKVNYYNFIGEHKKAIETAQPILNGKLTCAEVPHITYAPVLKSLLILNEKEEVEQLLPKAIKLIENSSHIVSEITSFIEIAYRLGNVDFAKELAEKYEAKILDNTDELNALKYFIATSPFVEENYERALTGSALFDKRNANSYYTDYLSEYTGREKREKKFFK